MNNINDFLLPLKRHLNYIIVQYIIQAGLIGSSAT